VHTFKELRLGTRGSALALWQARAVADRIAAAGGPPCRIITIKTSGDRLQDVPLSEIGGKRIFVKEIEDALLRDEIDLGVHSSKDMPAVLPPSLAIAAVLPREDPLDAVILPQNADGSARYTGSVGEHHAHVSAHHAPATDVDDLVACLGQTPAIGTSSVRRVAQLTRLFPNARFEPIRGNLDTRLRKLDDGQHDVIVLAAAGLRRLGMQRRISMTLPSSACVPSPGQGIVAIEIRADDDAVREIVSAFNDAQAWAALDAERAVVEILGGGCQTPIGALASPLIDANGHAGLDLVACVVAPDGSRAVRAQATGSMDHARALGERVAKQLLAEGAREILDDVRAVQHAGTTSTDS